MKGFGENTGLNNSPLLSTGSIFPQSTLLPSLCWEGRERWMRKTKSGSEAVCTGVGLGWEQAAGDWVWEGSPHPRTTAAAPPRGITSLLQVLWCLLEDEFCYRTAGLIGQESVFRGVLCIKNFSKYVGWKIFRAVLWYFWASKLWWTNNRRKGENESFATSNKISYKESRWKVKTLK